MPSYTHLLVNRLHDVLFLTLNCPATRNALAPDLVSELARAIAGAQGDPHLRAVVLRGSQGFFCAGGNIGNFHSRLAQELPQQSQGEQRQGDSAGDALASRLASDPVAARNREFGHFLQQLAALPVPLIAVVEGAAMGGGMGLACTADIVLATEDAKFALTETTLGIIPAQIAPFVDARIGRRNTLRLGLFGERIGGSQAVALGVVDALAPDSDALDALLAQWLTRMSRCAPGANQALKGLFTPQALASTATPPTLASRLDHAALAFARCMRHEGTEGIAAFREKRPAAWQAVFSAQEIRQAQAQSASPAVSAAESATAPSRMPTL